jgi:O-acetyl-ADP-ribose deacetylase (regulator of RNase III)
VAARYVIHTVGPVWAGGGQREAELLRSCYVNAMRLAEEYGLESIAFPAISTGAYGYPVEEAARVAVGAVKHTLVQVNDVRLVRFVCFSAGDFRIYDRLLIG